MKPQSGSQITELPALEDRNSGSQSPDRWLKGARYIQLILRYLENRTVLTSTNLTF